MIVLVAGIDLLLISHCMHINSVFVEFDTVLQSLRKEPTGESLLATMTFWIWDDPNQTFVTS